MKRPSEMIRDFFFENLEKSLENQRYNFSNSEKFMLWITGFSIGGLSIIVTNLTQFNQIFEYCVVKTILILLSISILFGIIFRWFFYKYQSQYQGIEFYLRGAFSNQDVMEIDPDDLSDENDIKEIVRRFKIDFDEDLSAFIQVYNNLGETGRSEMKNDLKDYYKRLGEWAKKDYEAGISYVKETYKNAFGISEKKVDKLFEKNSSKPLKISGFITSLALIISCLAFFLVIIILCIAY